MTQNSSTDTRRTLSGRERTLTLKRHALHCKYEKAVELYADTDMTIKDIAKECGVSAGGLGSYLRRYWRELVLRHYQIHMDGKEAKDIKIMEAGKQNENAHTKYKDAVAACDSLTYIDLNVSQIARKFGTDGTSLANFMRIHYAEVGKKCASGWALMTMFGTGQGRNALNNMQKPWNYIEIRT